MLHRCLLRLLLLLLVAEVLASPALAYQRESRVPLFGCARYFAASGSAKSFEIRQVSKEKDREVLVIEINNVPLRPGTLLIVFVNGENIGQVTLNSKRGATFKVESDFGKYVPTIEPGTLVEIKTADGRLVIR